MDRLTNGNMNVNVENAFNESSILPSKKLPLLQTVFKHESLLPCTEDEDYHVAFYNFMCPWDYLVNFSNVSADDSYTEKYSQLISLKRIKALVNNFELLLNQFRILIESSCSIDARTNESVQISGDDVKCDIEENSVILTENLSLLLGHTKSLRLVLLLKDSEKIESEYQRCSEILDMVVNNINYKVPDGNHQADTQLPGQDIHGYQQDDVSQSYNCMELTSLPGDQSLNSNSALNDEVQHTGKKTSNTKKGSNAARIKKIVPKKHDILKRTRIESMDPVGFKEQYCIPKEVYDKLILGGSPYTCPPCQRMFKSRRCFEYHLNNRCLGMSLKERGLEPKWEVEDGKLRCLFPGCGEEYLQKQTLYKHHQRAHIGENVELPWKCNQCDKSFIIKNSLSVHIKEVHREKIKQCCDICGASVGSKLKVHMLRHTGNKGISTSSYGLFIYFL